MNQANSMNALYGAVGVSFVVIYYILILAIVIVNMVGMGKMFVKAGKPWWAAIIPFYNLYCLYDMAWGNGWLFLLQFVPCVNCVCQVILCFKLAKAFDKGTGFGFGLLFLQPIFYLILGFSEAEYVGPQ